MLAFRAGSTPRNALEVRITSIHNKKVLHMKYTHVSKKQFQILLYSGMLFAILAFSILGFCILGDWMGFRNEAWAQEAVKVSCRITAPASIIWIISLVAWPICMAMKGYPGFFKYLEEYAKKPAPANAK